MRDFGDWRPAISWGAAFAILLAIPYAIAGFDWLAIGSATLGTSTLYALKEGGL